MRTKVLIVEDEMPSARKLMAFINDLEPEFEIVDTLDSVSQTIEFLKSNKVDLIFLDIHLADGNSFSIFKAIEVETPIIFTTAYDQYAIEAFKQNSIGYLLKPLSKEDLKVSIEKFKKGRQESSSGIDYKLLGQLIQKSHSKDDYQERFMVHYKDKIKSITIDEIAYFHAEGKYVFLTLHSGQSYDVNLTIEQLESKVNPGIFFRINRAYIVNIKAIKEASVYSKSKLKLTLIPEANEDVIISSSKTTKFKQWLNQ